MPRLEYLPSKVYGSCLEGARQLPDQLYQGFVSSPTRKKTHTCAHTLGRVFGGPKGLSQFSWRG